MSSFLACHRVSLFLWLLLGLSLHFYRVRELLVCWLFFGGTLVVLGSIIAAGILAWYGGTFAFHWASALAQTGLAVLSDRVGIRSTRSQTLGSGDSPGSLVRPCEEVLHKTV